MSTGIIVISLGPGDPDLLNRKTVQALKSAGQVFLRTGKHPIVSWLNEMHIPYTTLDHLYEESDDFDQLNRNAAELLISHGIASFQLLTQS